MENENNKFGFGDDMTLIDLVLLFKDNIMKLVLSVLSGIVVAVMVTYLFISPKYSSTADLIINDPNSTEQTINSTIIQTNMSLLNTYEGIIEKPNVLQKAIDDTGVDLTVGELANMTSVSTLDDSLLLSINVVSESPYISSTLANSIATNFSLEVQKLLKIDNVFLWNEAVPMSTPVSPDVLLNIVIGAILGALIGSIFIIVLFIKDPTVKSSNIIEQLDLTPLGTVSLMSSDLKKETQLGKSNYKTEIDNNKRRV